MAYISTYHVGDTNLRTLTLESSDGGGWLDAGDTVTLVDYLPGGTTAVVHATVVTVGDNTNPSMITAPAPDTTNIGNILTEVRKASLSGTIETFSEDLVYVVEP